ncbi:hypothetical protein TELCIR_10811 [Teladorsagia circumcincta]|uniref:Uncharacterized protein n=1 Tax=Teladorsagia circumcincta TaxID=45464 RepID=A0A2G9UDB1_TELCI|nr:hypothetical protein TELCIR_10811 [Teladorsagia circumcincta]
MGTRLPSAGRDIDPMLAGNTTAISTMAHRQDIAGSVLYIWSGSYVDFVKIHL